MNECFKWFDIFSMVPNINLNGFENVCFIFFYINFFLEFAELEMVNTIINKFEPIGSRGSSAADSARVYWENMRHYMHYQLASANVLKSKEEIETEKMNDNFLETMMKSPLHHHRKVEATNSNNDSQNNNGSQSKSSNSSLSTTTNNNSTNASQNTNASKKTKTNSPSHISSKKNQFSVNDIDIKHRGLLSQIEAMNQKLLQQRDEFSSLMTNSSNKYFTQQQSQPTRVEGVSSKPEQTKGIFFFWSQESRK